MGINTGNNIIKGINVGSNVISRAFLGSVKIYDQLDYPTLDLNFAATKSLDPRITFTRASSGTYFDSNGVMQLASANTPRFDHNPTSLESLGLLIEEQRTNSIRNNTMQGAVAGTPGTLPTNWLQAGVGLAANVIGTGTEAGISYIDIQFVGTAASSSSALRFGPTNQTAAVSGQTWTGSMYIRRIAGTTTGLSAVTVNIFGRTSTNTSNTDGGITQIMSELDAASISVNRKLHSATLSNATTAFVNMQLAFGHSTGSAIDITLRIGMPQLELGAFATSVIPTFGTAATRAADVAVMTGTNFSSWYQQDEGTLFAEYSYSVTGVSNLCAYSLDDGTANETIVNATATPNIDRVLSSAGGVSQANFGNFNYIVGQVVKRAVAVKLNNAATTANGSAVATDDNYTMPVPTQLTIGAAGYFTSSRINGCIRRIAYFNRRLADSEIQLLTV